MSKDEAAEFIRGMSNLELAVQLAGFEKAALAAVADDLDPRRDIATEQLSVIAQIRKHRHYGWDTSTLESQVLRLAQRGDELILRPFVEDGVQVRAGRAKGRAALAAGRTERIARWQPRYLQIRAGGITPQRARKQVMTESKGTPLEVTERWCRNYLREAPGKK